MRRVCVRKWEVSPKNGGRLASEIGVKGEVGLINRCEVGGWPQK